jgi:hypothetical protein
MSPVKASVIRLGPRSHTGLALVVAVAFVGCSHPRAGNPSATITTSPKIALSGPPSTSAAERACLNPSLRHLAGPHSTLRGAFDSTQGTLDQWTGGRRPSDVDSAKVYLCYFDGGPYSTSRDVMSPPFPDFNRVLVVVKTDGTTTQDAYGYHDMKGYPDLPLDAPPSKPPGTP